MKRAATTFMALAFMAGAAFAGSYRVSYTHRGLGKRITVSAESTQDARRTVQDLFPSCYVTGAYKTGR